MKRYLIFFILAVVYSGIAASGQSQQQLVEQNQQSQQQQSTRHTQQQIEQQQEVQQEPPQRVKVEVPDFAQAQLNELGFVVVYNDYEDELANLYRNYKGNHWPILVTSDAMLHSSHLVFDWYQRFLEIAYLRDDLIQLTDVLLSKMMEYSDSYEGSLREAALYNAAFFTVGKGLLIESDYNDVPAPWQDKIKQELSLIMTAQGVSESPLFGYKEDYTQYKPRGHYSRSKEFQEYFRSMAWYGRMVFLLKTDDATVSDRQTLQALLICSALDQSQVKGQKAFDVWKRIYETTALFAGYSDDLTVEEYLSLKKQIYGQGEGKLDDKKLLLKFKTEAGKLRKPKILSTESLAASQGGPNWRESTAGMRVFGTRYSFDSEIMQRLTYDNVHEFLGPASPDKPFTLVNAGGQSIRGFPRGLDVFSAFSFPQAGELLKAGGDDQYRGYQEQLARLRKELSAIDAKQWKESLYTGRLKAALVLANEPKGILPKAMKEKVWKLKQLTAAIGSWAELRHDTILYTKQPYSMSQMAMAGMSKGGRVPPPPPPPHGYVEPVPELYSALKDCFALLESRIKSLGFPEDKAMNQGMVRFQNTLDKLEGIALKELAGEILTDEEYKFIEYIYGTLSIPEIGLPHHRDVSNEFMTAMDNKMPVIADVFTDLNSKMALEEAVGRPMKLYMVCSVDGEPTVCIGAVYSYYEFKQPIDKRMTDEEWRELIKQNKQPEQAEWIKSYLAKKAP
jgi:hypothetical protein